MIESPNRAMQALLVLIKFLIRYGFSCLLWIALLLVCMERLGRLHDKPDQPRRLPDTFTASNDEAGTLPEELHVTQVAMNAARHQYLDALSNYSRALSVVERTDRELVARAQSPSASTPTLAENRNRNRNDLQVAVRPPNALRPSSSLSPSNRQRPAQLRRLSAPEAAPPLTLPYGHQQPRVVDKGLATTVATPPSTARHFAPAAPVGPSRDIQAGYWGQSN